MMNRSLLSATALMVALSGAAFCPASAAESIKIGVPIGLSGANSVVAPSVVQSAQLAVAQINAAGGVMGRPLELIVADDQSGAAGAQKAFDSLIFQKKVDALISMETSAARNAALPIVARGKTPYIYTSYYEGHSCSPYMYAESWVPDQQVAPVVDLFIGEKKAKTFFLIGSDYAYGRGMLGFSRAYIEKQGGKVVGEEYNPMDASDWTAIISKVREANPDALILATAGGAPNVTLTKQYKAAGVTALIGNIGVDEGTAKSMGADAEGVFISASYVSSLDTPENDKFIASMKAKFGDGLKTPNDLSVPEYEAIYLYKAAVEKAGSTNEDAVLKALDQVSYVGPRGLIKMDRQRHAALTMYLGQVQADGSVKVVKAFKDVDPGAQCPALN